MASQQNDGTSYQPSEPKPCANNCGFFGTAGNLNLCSKCYRDLCIQEERALSAKSAVEKSLSQPSAAASAAPSIFSAVPAAEASSSAEMTFGNGATLKAAAKRCGNCNKKVGLTGFVCKCGITFCGTHRYPEKHDCSYDYHGAGRAAISKANPVVKADKLDKI